MVQINRYSQSDTQEVVDLVLHCQNDGSRPTVGVEEQPDLLDIESNYFNAGGYFWVAKENRKVVGTIALMNEGNGIGFLKKFFVYEQFRGTPHHLGQALYAELLKFAKTNNIKQIYLTTPKNTERAHKFYTKAGFVLLPIAERPNFAQDPYDDVDCFVLTL